MRILITGASGLLGLNLGLLLNQKNEVIGVDRSTLGGVPFRLLSANLLEAHAVDEILGTIRPDAVIHCAANANMESCEADPQSAARLNAQLPGELSAGCAERGVRFVHISTDAVFDGTKQGFYTEEDSPSPSNVYAETKLQGEEFVLKANPRALVARVNFFGWSLSGQRSLAEFFFNKLSAGKSCNGFQDVWFCPMFVGHLAETLVTMLEKELSGLFHVTGSEALSKYEFGLRLARKFGFDETLITPISVDDSHLTVKRSHNMRLSTQKLSTALGQVIPGVSAGLDGFYAQYQQGYPQKLAGYQQGKFI